MGRKVNREYQLKQNELDRQRIPVICIDCGIEYTLSKAYIRQHKDAPRRCKACGKKHASAKISENYKNMTEEEKLNKTKGIRNYYKSLTPEEREAYMKPLYKGRDKYYSTRSEEEKERMALEISNRNKKYHALLSEEEKQQYRQVRKDAYDNFSQEKKDEFRIRSEKQWEGLSPEEIEERMQPLRKGIKNYWSNISEEDKAIHIKKLTDGQKEWWNNLSDEEQAYCMKRLHDGYDKWLNSMTEEERNIQINAIAKHVSEMTQEEFNAMMLNRYKPDTIIPNTGEIEFQKHLDSNNIRYTFQFVNKIVDKNFHTIFPVNPVTKGKVSPYHMWDFIIYLRNKEVLVDIDGSIHDTSKTNKNVTYNKDQEVELSELISFNDSKRPYQTDGLEAYIIKAYNDKIEDDTIVQNVKTNECIKFKDFLNTLILDSMDEKDVKDLIKLSLK